MANKVPKHSPYVMAALKKMPAHPASKSGGKVAQKPKSSGKKARPVSAGKGNGMKGGVIMC